MNITNMARCALAALVALTALSFSPADVAAQEAAPVVDIDYIERNGVPGLYITRSDGTVETVGSAGLASTAHRGLDPGEKVVALEVDRSRVPPLSHGYWLFTDAGRAIPYATGYYGGAASLDLDQPIIAAAATTTGRGYYMVGADGGIFTFGDARFHGSIPEVLPGVTLDAPVIGIVTSESGYLLVASDGGIFTFGDAQFHGSVPGVLPGVALNAPVVGVVPQASGYMMVASDGGIFTFGAVEFHGSLGDALVSDVVGAALLPDGGYVMTSSSGVRFNFGPVPSTLGGGFPPDDGVTPFAAVDEDFGTFGTYTWTCEGDGSSALVEVTLTSSYPHTINVAFGSLIERQSDLARIGVALQRVDNVQPGERVLIRAAVFVGSDIAFFCSRPVFGIARS